MADLKSLFAIDPGILSAPRRDNSVYLDALARMRKAYHEAEAVLGGPVYIAKSETVESDGDYTIKTVFRRVGE